MTDVGAPGPRQGRKVARATSAVTRSPGSSARSVCSSARSSTSCARSSGRRARELVTYTVVVIVFVCSCMALVSSLDFGFQKPSSGLRRLTSRMPHCSPLASRRDLNIALKEVGQHVSDQWTPGPESTPETLVVDEVITDTDRGPVVEGEVTPEGDLQARAESDAGPRTSTAVDDVRASTDDSPEADVARPRPPRPTTPRPRRTSGPRSTRRRARGRRLSDERERPRRDRRRSTPTPRPADPMEEFRHALREQGGRLVRRPLLRGLREPGEGQPGEPDHLA